MHLAIPAEMDELQRQIDAKRRSIHTNSYSMSVGELISLYKDGELEIHPAYQRLFRWTDDQKSKLVDSILLGIPLPSIFVAQRDDGKWEIVDGLQRICTLLEVAGELKDAGGQKRKALELRGTEYLPALAGKTWTSGVPGMALTGTQRLLIKRAKIDVQIVLKESDGGSKYELFQRLNSGGSAATPAELRNCLLVMSNSAFAEWFNKLTRLDSFRAAISISERYDNEGGDLDLAARFLALRDATEEEVRTIDDVSSFVDRRMQEFASRWKAADRERAEAIFRRTFGALDEALGEDAFRRFDSKTKRFAGPFLISAFEALAAGLGALDPDEPLPDAAHIRKSAQSLWRDSGFTDNIGGGVPARVRIRATIPLGRRLFRKAG